MPEQNMPAADHDIVSIACWDPNLATRTWIPSVVETRASERSFGGHAQTRRCFEGPPPGGSICLLYLHGTRNIDQGDTPRCGPEPVQLFAQRCNQDRQLLDRVSAAHCLPWLLGRIAALRGSESSRLNSSPEYSL